MLCYRMSITVHYREKVTFSHQPKMPKMQFFVLFLRKSQAAKFRPAAVPILCYVYG